MGVCSSTESAGAPPTPVSERQQPQTPRSGPASGRRPSSGCVGEIACVVSDFAAEAAEELAVRRGEFVTISAGPTREGWCAVSVERAGEAAPRSGLVPWSHLVSAAHANEAAAASGASPAMTAASGASPARVLSPRVSAETEDIAIARGAGGRLGVDLDDDNRVRNVASGGCPPLSASLLFSLHSPSLPPLPPCRLSVPAAYLLPCCLSSPLPPLSSAAPSLLPAASLPQALLPPACSASATRSWRSTASLSPAARSSRSSTRSSRATS